MSLRFLVLVVMAVGFCVIQFIVVIGAVRSDGSGSRRANLSEDCEVLFGILSAPKNEFWRSLMRKNWIEELPSRFCYRFFVGDIPADMTSAVDHEQQQHGDIVSLPMHDSYKTISIKTVGIAHWFIHNTKCSHLIKIDDDVHVFLPKVEAVLAENTAHDLYGCAGELIVGSKPHRDPTGRSHVTVEQYGEDSYPPYCGGMMYILGRTTANVLGENFRPDNFAQMDGFPEDAQTGIILHQDGKSPKMLVSDELLLGCLFEWGLGYPKKIYRDFYQDATPIARMHKGKLEAACYRVTHYKKQSSRHHHRPCLCTIVPDTVR